MKEAVLRRIKNHLLGLIITYGLINYSSLSQAQTYIICDVKTQNKGIDSILIHQTLLKEFLIRDVAIYPEDINRLIKCLSLVNFVMVDSIINNEWQKYYLVDLLPDSVFQSCYYDGKNTNSSYNYLISGVFKTPARVILNYDYNTLVLYRIKGFTKSDEFEFKRDFTPIFQADRRKVKTWIRSY